MKNEAGYFNYSLPHGLMTPIRNNYNKKKSLYSVNSQPLGSFLSSKFSFYGDSAFLVSLSGVKQSDFSKKSYYDYNYYSLTNAKIFDAEKDDYNANKTQDDYSCWAASVANMLAYTGWGADGLKLTQNNTIEDKIFNYFYSNFLYGDSYGSHQAYGVEWFFDGSYYPQGWGGWDQPGSGGNTLNRSASPYLSRTSMYDYDCDSFTMMESLAKALQSGSAVGLGLHGAMDHAVTCWGFTIDKSLATSDPYKYTGLFITDSDDNKTQKSPNDTMRYVPLTWTGYKYLYGTEYQWDGYNCYIEDITVLSQKPASLSIIVPYGSILDTSSKASYDVSGVLNIKKGGKASNSIIQSSGEINVSSGGIAIKTSVSAGGRLYISKGGMASETTINGSGYWNTGIQYVLSGGVASATTVNRGGYEYVYSCGVASATTVNSGGYQGVSSGGVASATTVKSNGSQFVSSGGVANETTVKDRGIQAVEGGVANMTTVNSGGSQSVSFGGVANATTVNSGGGQVIYFSGVANNAVIKNGFQSVEFGVANATTVKGNFANQTIYSSGVANATSVNSGSFQQVLSGGVANATSVNSGGAQVISSGGAANATSVNSGGSQVVSSGGVANATSVKNGGFQAVSAGGVASATTISGGIQQVYSRGVVNTATIQKGGILTLNKGAKATALKLQSSGSLVISSGGTASMASIANGAKLSLKAGGTLNLAAGNVLYGKNSFTGATVTGGSKDKRVALAEESTLTVGTNTTMKKLHLNISDATLNVTGIGNTLGSVKINKRTNVGYNVSKVKASGTSCMLALSTVNSQKLGEFSVTVGKNQGIGTYELSTNIDQAKGTEYIVNLGTTKLGVAKLNSTSLTKNGVTYSVKTSGTQTNLTLAIKAGKLLKGATKNDTLTGTSHSDIFYGGKGNDTITGTNGRDVAIFDTTAWGKNTIAKTSGTMTLLFKDLKESDIVKTSSGSDMIITKAKDAKQSVTIKGWSDTTHNIVFGSKMTAFNTYLNTASPTDKQITAARNEAFKKAGLASA